MKTMKLFLGLFAAGAIMFLGACKKDPGTGGKAHIHGAAEVEATEEAVANTVVSIWYGKVAPEGSADSYVMTDASGGFEFENLQKGEYYLYCSYFDPTSGETLTGGAAVTISKKKEEVEKHLHVE